MQSKAFKENTSRDVTGKIKKMLCIELNSLKIQKEGPFQITAMSL